MNTSPIDSWDGAAEVFTFGAGSFGVWLFLALSVIAFVGFIARAMRHESRSFAEVESIHAAMYAPASSEAYAVPGAVKPTSTVA